MSDAKVLKYVASLEAVLDLIAYKCADYDSELCMANAMFDEKMPVLEGKAKAGDEIDRLITASGYKVKDRPEDDG